MSSTADLYADEVKKHFKTLYANWEPGAPLRLGDYGTLHGNVFVPEGNLEEDYPQDFPSGFITTRPDGTSDHKEFKSESGVDVDVNAKGTIGPGGLPYAKANIEVKFGKKNAIFFDAAGCTTERISNKAKVGEVLEKLYKKDKWKSKYCVVTDLVTAGRTIIAVSQSATSSITIEASSDQVAQIDLADASVRVGFTSQKSIGYKVDAESGLHLLMGLCQYRSGFLGMNEGFDVRTIASRSIAPKSLRLAAPKADMRFVQLGLE